MGDFTKKKNRTDFVGKKFLHGKKIYILRPIMLRKICYTIICLGRKFYLHRRFVGKKSYPNQIKSPSTHQVKWSPPQERKA